MCLRRFGDYRSPDVIFLNYKKDMFNKKIACAGAILGFALSAIAPALPAAAAVPADVFKDSQGNIYIHGSTATALGGQAIVGTDTPLYRNIRAGYCGEIRISPSTSQPDIGSSWVVNDGASIALASLNNVGSDAPRCSSNAFVPAVASPGFTDSDGRAVLTGFTPGVSYQVQFEGQTASRSIRPNNCGFFRISNTTRNPAPGRITVSGTNHTTSSLPVSAPPLCQRNSETGAYVRYIPSTW
jgi:hypothetical protein